VASFLHPLRDGVGWQVKYCDGDMEKLGLDELKLILAKSAACKDQGDAAVIDHVRGGAHVRVAD
jgi:hypothetical protein